MKNLIIFVASVKLEKEFRIFFIRLVFWNHYKLLSAALACMTGRFRAHFFGQFWNKIAGMSSEAHPSKADLIPDVLETGYSVTAMLLWSI